LKDYAKLGDDDIESVKLLDGKTLEELMKESNDQLVILLDKPFNLKNKVAKKIHRRVTEANKEFRHIQMFEVGHDLKSMTKSPGYFPIEKPYKDEDDNKYYGTYLVDGAGFNDNNPAHEAPNQTAIQRVLKGAQCFKLVLLIHCG